MRPAGGLVQELSPPGSELDDSYNLGNLWRRLVLPTRIKKRSLTYVPPRLVKMGAVDQARAQRLAAVGREQPDAAALWTHGAARGGGAGARWIRRGVAGEPNRAKEGGDAEESEKLLELEAIAGCPVPGRGRRTSLWATGVAREGKDEKTGPTEAAGCILAAGREGTMDILVHPAELMVAARSTRSTCERGWRTSAFPLRSCQVCAKSWPHT
jgi:hypothetical protein